MSRHGNGLRSFRVHATGVLWTWTFCWPANGLDNRILWILHVPIVSANATNETDRHAVHQENNVYICRLVMIRYLPTSILDISVIGCEILGLEVP